MNLNHTALEAPPIICLMGPTASGKTPLAIEIAKRFPCEIISVDSRMVYRDMNIGTAKPTQTILTTIPHHLIDVRDPKEVYTAGQFHRDVLDIIEMIIARNHVPLLVGGTMLYFRILERGFAKLPKTDLSLRCELERKAASEGLESLHKALAKVDPHAFFRIHPNDRQRILRAWEVFLLTQQTLSAHQATTLPLSGYCMHHFALALERFNLHERISKRLMEMLELGLIDEVVALRDRDDLNKDLPAFRSVGYQEIWDYLDGKLVYKEMCEKIMIATRQLAKRQLTWLRSWPNMNWLNAESSAKLDEAFQWVDNIIKHHIRFKGC